MTTSAVAAATMTQNSTNDINNNNPVPGLTAEQVQQILSLIDNCKARTEKLQGNILWLYDTGASCHMTGTYEVLDSIRTIEPITVLLPNGNKAMAS